jgi:hypothetical protein
MLASKTESKKQGDTCNYLKKDRGNPFRKRKIEKLKNISKRLRGE